jgi:hypothetical protein
VEKERPLDGNQKRQLVLKLLSRMRCQACGQRYKHQSFSRIYKQSDVWVLRTRCANCGKESHVIVFLHLNAEPDPPTELTLDEIEAAAEQPPISADDVLDMHHLLKEFDGDFQELFSS